LTEILPLALAGAFDHGNTPNVPPDRHGTERMVAETVVRVTVGVDHGRHTKRRECFKVAPDLFGLAMRASGIDEDDAVSAHDRPDLLVGELVTLCEDAVAELLPSRHWVERANSVGRILNPGPRSLG